MKKTILLASMLVALFGLARLRPPVSQATSNTNGLTISGSSLAFQTVFSPKITKAAFEKKDLIVEGENFAAGAKIILNGTKPLKTQNDASTPATKLMVKKASKTLPDEEIVSLQVKNPDENISEAIGFFTGLTLTFHNTIDGASTSLQVDQIFLVNFDDLGFWPWQIYDYRNLGTVIDLLSFKVPLLPKAQGLFFAKQPGSAHISLRGEPFGGVPFLWVLNLDVN